MVLCTLEQSEILEKSKLPELQQEKRDLELKHQNALKQLEVSFF